MTTTDGAAWGAPSVKPYDDRSEIDCREKMRTSLVLPDKTGHLIVYLDRTGIPDAPEIADPELLKFHYPPFSWGPRKRSSLK